MWYDVKKRLKKNYGCRRSSILNGSITPQIIDLSENNYPYCKYGGNISYPLPIEYINFLKRLSYGSSNQTIPHKNHIHNTVCIGDGQKLSPFSDYKLKVDKLIYLNQETIQQILKTRPNLIEDFVKELITGWIIREVNLISKVFL
jgi:hypothetical protein